MGFNSVTMKLLEPSIFSGNFFSSVMAAITSVIMSTFNYYCWASVTTN